ncbi:glycosyltransferase family 4 protein [Candidatus Microgenomates bacterium]|jgi:glycosyltransferase involved in cell wall biosynthesis|nr:MAG: glycosyltransferase family 4 protein [Candidatus Microgenomates bacterium]
MKVAFVYDRVNKWGGAERVLLSLHKIWPEAPLFTSVYNSKTAAWADCFKVVPSFLQKIPLARTHHELFPLLMPLAFESFDFSEFDVVISVTSEAAKGIITKPKTLHVCYCLTPTRYLWSGYDHYFDTKFKKVLSGPLTAYLRVWDKIAGKRPDEFLAISETVKQRIKKYYGRESSVIYPPVDHKFQTPNPKSQNYFLVVSRLVKYKKVDLVVRAFNQLDYQLKIVGTGSEMASLRKIAGKNIEFLGQLTDKELLSYYQNCQAVIFPQEEDFGIVPLEAQASGRPVIAFRAGGATETIVEKETGLFFDSQKEESLLEVLGRFKPEEFSKEKCFLQAEKFREERFLKEFYNYIKDKWKSHTKTTYMF